MATKTGTILCLFSSWVEMIAGNPVISGGVQTAIATVLQDLRFALRVLSRKPEFHCGGRGRVGARNRRQ
jgi:hypothetical protein